MQAARIKVAKIRKERRAQQHQPKQRPMSKISLTQLAAQKNVEPTLRDQIKELQDQNRQLQEQLRASQQTADNERKMRCVAQAGRVDERRQAKLRLDISSAQARYNYTNMEAFRYGMRRLECEPEVLQEALRCEEADDMVLDSVRQGNQPQQLPTPPGTPEATMTDWTPVSPTSPMYCSHYAPNINTSVAQGDNDETMTDKIPARAADKGNNRRAHGARSSFWAAVPEKKEVTLSGSTHAPPLDTDMPDSSPYTESRFGKKAAPYQAQHNTAAQPGLRSSAQQTHRPGNFLSQGSTKASQGDSAMSDAPSPSPMARTSTALRPIVGDSAASSIGMHYIGGGTKETSTPTQATSGRQNPALYGNQVSSGETNAVLAARLKQEYMSKRGMNANNTSPLSRSTTTASGNTTSAHSSGMSGTTAKTTTTNVPFSSLNSSPSPFLGYATQNTSPLRAVSSVSPQRNTNSAASPAGGVPLNLSTPISISQSKPGTFLRRGNTQTPPSGPAGSSPGPNAMRSDPDGNGLSSGGIKSVPTGGLKTPKMVYDPASVPFA